MVKKKKLQLKVIFDTNAIYTASASDLLRREVVELILGHQSLEDIEIEWYIPETVIKERIFQMNKKGNELLPSIQKLEKLLGHNLNITSEIVGSRINAVIEKQLTDYGIYTIKIDTSKVDWDSIIHSSLNRKPPFEDNEKEKGFRDALILESVKQIVSGWPITKSICRIVFITSDILLNSATTEAKLPANLSVLANVGELTSLINILNSEITEELINKIIEDANRLFFETNNMSTLYFSQGVSGRILKEFEHELNIKADGANARENGTWWIGKPGFEQKNKQKVIWKTPITIDFTSYKITWLPSSNESLFNYQKTNIGMGLQLPSSEKIFSPNTINNYNKTKEKMSDGKTNFEVTWSITLTTDNKLKNPKIEDIKYLDTTFI